MPSWFLFALLSGLLIAVVNILDSIDEVGEKF